MERLQENVSSRWAWEATPRAPFIWTAIVSLVCFVLYIGLLAAKSMADETLKNLDEDQIRPAQIARNAGLQQTDPAFRFAWNAETSCESRFFAAEEKCLQATYALIEHSALSADQQKQAKNVAEQMAGVR